MEDFSASKERGYAVQHPAPAGPSALKGVWFEKTMIIMDKRMVRPLSYLQEQGPGVLNSCLNSNEQQVG